MLPLLATAFVAKHSCQPVRAEDEGPHLATAGHSAVLNAAAMAL
jgi:hypothetical protein